MQSFEQDPEFGVAVIRPYYYPNYIKVSLFVIFCFFLQSLFFGSKDILAARAYNLAKKQYDLGNYGDAKENYYHVLNYAPNSEDAKIGLALTCFSNKDTTDDWEGLQNLRGISFSDNELNKIKKAIPEKYKKYLIDQKGEYQ